MSVVKVALGVIFCILVPGILQCYGFFLDEWATSSDPNCTMNIGITDVTDNSTCVEGLGTVFVLEYIPTYVFILPLLATVASVYTTCRTGNDDDLTCACLIIMWVLWLASICCTIIFPFLGIMILIGCIVFSTHFPTSALGPSFYYCLFAGICHIFGMVYISINCYRKRSADDEAPADEGGHTTSATVISYRYTFISIME